jgi:hypothetical protein
MSEINDALKHARQTPPGGPAGPVKPPVLPPRRWGAQEKPPVLIGWIIPIFIIILIFAGIFFIGWASAHHTIQSAIVPHDDIATTQEVTDFVPVVQSPAPAPLPPLAPVAAPDLPKLQGIFYSPTAPTAIVDGKTISPGDRFGDYRVKEISKYAVTLTDTNGKEIRISLGN